MAKRRSRGEGSIYFRESKGLWVAKLTLPDGKSRLKYAKSQKVVREWLQTQQNALRQGLYPKDDTVTVSAFLGSYMGVVKNNLRPKTLEAYSYLIRLHISSVLGKIKLSQLRPDQLQTFYKQKLESGLSRRTVQFMHSVIHKALKQALRWGLVYRNVADLVDAPSPAKRLPTIWNAEQVNVFLNAVKNDRLYLAYVLAIYGGFREGEILGIHVEDCQIPNGTITVNHAVQYTIGNGVVVTHPKTDKSCRSVKLPQTAINALTMHLSQLKRNQGLIFTTSSGKLVNPRFLINKFKEAIAVAGLPEIRFHDLRHTSATLLLSANVHPKIVQERFGHSTITLTMDQYSHVIPGMQDEAAEKLDNVLSTPSVHPIQ